MGKTRTTPEEVRKAFETSSKEQSRKINAYICEYLHVTSTIDLVEGTTPMFIRCEQCAKEGRVCMASSRMYRVNQSVVPTHEWYAPSDDELKALSKSMDANTLVAMLEHVQKGGLLLRKRKEVSNG
jgi:hypothetical protein